MSWLAIASLAVFVSALTTLWGGPQPEWSERRAWVELLWVIVGILVGVYGLRNY